MDEKEQKQLARKRRERKLRAWLMTLSWTTPVVAFGGFFTIWHHISTAVNPPQQPSQTSVSTPSGSNTTSTNQSQVLLQIGSSGRQVRALQEQLAELGYFHHRTTHYYGTVTADAVTAFQADHNLPQTGTVDSNTLTAIGQAVKDNSANNLVQSGDDGNSGSNMGGDDSSNSQPSYGSYSYSGSNGLSQQQAPITRSSAS